MGVPLFLSEDNILSLSSHVYFIEYLPGPGIIYIFFWV
jgi:hypothetical protein